MQVHEQTGRSRVGSLIINPGDVLMKFVFALPANISFLVSGPGGRRLWPGDTVKFSWYLKL